jgi:tRNA threonylcarbamoyladenosine biosynthesis protein TsaE
MRETFSVREEDMGELASKVVHLLAGFDTSKAKVLLLDGDLGAGKTTFTKELAGTIGIERGHVNSPTFILKKEYKTSHPTFKKLVHVDAYRFSTPKEAKVLRLEDDLDEPETIIAIEWPSKMKTPKADLHLLFTVVDDETREVCVTYED